VVTKVTDTISDFSDRYWRAALGLDGRTWPFSKFNLCPCVPGFQDEWRDTKIAKARLTYAPYDLVTERPLLFARLSHDHKHSRPFLFELIHDTSSAYLLITNKYLYCTGHRPVSLVDMSEIKIVTRDIRTPYPATTLSFPDSPVTATLVVYGSGSHTEALFLADFLRHIRDNRLTVDEHEITSLIHPSLGNTFVGELRRIGVYHNTLVEISRSAYADEHVLGILGTGKGKSGGFLILSNRRVISVSTYYVHGESDQCPLANAPQLHVEEVYDRGPYPGHTPHLHLHDHPVVNLLSVPAAHLIDKYKTKKYYESLFSS
jgi:hypothetical protein